MSSLTRCQLQYVIHFTYFVSYLVNITCFLLCIYFTSKSLQSTFSSKPFCFCIPEAHNTANYLLNVMIANPTISLTCSECLKYKGSHLLVRCPWQTASIESKECYHASLRSYFPPKLKNQIFCSPVLPPRTCQHGVMSTIDNSTGSSTAYARICYRRPRSLRPSFRIKMLTSARKSTPHPGRAFASFESNQVG